MWQFSAVADIAGGKGYLQLALKEQGYQRVTTFDKRYRKVKGIDFRYSYFSGAVKDHFDLLVGMHPDGATDVIIAEAVSRNIPFVICPCCIKPTAFLCFPYKGDTSNYNGWMRHLKKQSLDLGYRLEEYRLPMNGKSDVLVGFPDKYPPRSKCVII